MKKNFTRRESYKDYVAELRRLLKVHIHWASDARNQWSHSRLHSFPSNQQYGIHKNTVFFLPYCDNFWHKLSKYGKKNNVYLCLPYCLFPAKLWSLAWDYGSRAWDAQCMCTFRMSEKDYQCSGSTTTTATCEEAWYENPEHLGMNKPEEQLGPYRSWWWKYQLSK